MRPKKSGNNAYLQVVENRREGKKVRQRVVATLGRLDELTQSGKLDSFLISCGKFAVNVAVLAVHRRGELPAAKILRIGPLMVFERLWTRLGVKQTLESLLADRKFGFSVERAIFLTVLHRLFAPGSDRAAEEWRKRYKIDGVAEISLHHVYRSMAWLGEELPQDQQCGATPLAPRCVKDRIEGALFAREPDLFSGVDLVFFDTTSIYFEGEGGETIGKRGKSKDHRPDLKQMVVGVVLDRDGHPFCCELWPGNTTDLKTLIPIINRLRGRFRIVSVCVVADRGMISAETIKQLEGANPPIRYVLGARMRAQKEVKGEVLSRAGRYKEVFAGRKRSKDPAPLKVKEVWVKERRYVVCYGEEEAKKDRANREAIVAALGDKLNEGDKSLVGNKGFRKYLKTSSGGEHFSLDETKFKEEARYDGKWVLRTNTDFSASEVGLRYRELWMVEALFRVIKSILETRPIFHKVDETIRGHVFCSFLALKVMKTLLDEMEKRGWGCEWERLKNDLDAVEEVEVDSSGKRFLLRSETPGDAGKAFQAVGVALPPTIRRPWANGACGRKGQAERSVICGAGTTME